MKSIVVTTSVKTNNELNEKAHNIAKFLNLDYIPRNKRTIKQMLTQADGVIVVYKTKLSYFEGDKELFFHLDTSALKIKNNDNEPLIEIIDNEKQNILDCTMGLAGDSIILSYYEHKVTALEKNKIIYLIVSNGLKNYISHDEKINSSMRRIITHNIDSVKFLKNCPDNSFDIVYFDPMFSHNIEESKNLAGIETLANQDFPTADFLIEAKRVAKKKVIVKAHFKDDIFEKFDFIRLMRKNTKFHYGYIDTNIEKTKN